MRLSAFITTTSLIVTLFNAALLSAQPLQPTILVNPLHSPVAPRFIQAYPVNTGSHDPRLDAISQFLQTHKTAFSANQTANPTISSQLKTVNKLTESIASKLSVRLTEARTPRQIKAKNAVLMQRIAGSTPSNSVETEAAVFTAKQFLNASRQLLRLENPAKEMIFKTSQSDSLGKQHIRFQQFYQNLPVWNCELTVHLNVSGDIELVDGVFFPSPKKINLKPIYTAAQATETARLSISQGADAAVTSPSLLVIYPEPGKQPRLAWEVNVSAGLNQHWLILVDAHSGQQILAYNRANDAATTGSGVDLLGNQRQLNLFEDNNRFFLADISKPMFKGSSPFPITSGTGVIYILDDKNQSAINSDGEVQLPERLALSSSQDRNNWSKDAVSAAFGLSATYDYYSQVHSRNSIDGNGGSIFAVVRVGSNYGNAFWNGQLIAFGDAIPFAGALDVVGHELTHGVIQNTANLIYLNQSGALNEALADIFGEAIEAHTTGQADWVTGGQLGSPLRNLRNPGSINYARNRPYPAIMSEFIQLPPTTEGDFGGIHINSSIINHAFYLIAEGLDGAIGINDAEQIFYRAMAFHLVPRSRFLDARLAVIQSATEIYGENSVQAQKAAQAFDAVEIFDAPASPDTGDVSTISGPDATVFIEFDSRFSNYFLKRRDPALNDPPSGTNLSFSSVSPKRPSVDRNTGLVAFINSNHVLCLISSTNGNNEQCLDPSIKVHSIAVSADGEKFALVFRDSLDQPENQIAIIDISSTGQNQTIDLVAPASEGASTTTIVNADAMDFTNDGQFLVYDAFNEITTADGSRIGVWSIYAIDLANQTTIALVPPRKGFHFAFPSLSQTTDDFLTFDALNLNSGINTVTAASLVTGKTHDIHTSGDFGTPSYTGDDRGIIYSQVDQTTTTGFSLFKQPLQADHITPSGDAAPWLVNADYGVIYRRGNTITTPQNPQPLIKEGLWWIPTKPGSGFDIQVTSNHDLFMIWYTYKLDGSPIWYLASGPLNGNNWSADIFEFVWDGSTAIPSRAGDARLTFRDNSHASLVWTLNTGNGTSDIEYFVFDQGDAFDSGTWFEPARPGYGLTQISQGSTQVRVLYFYDLAGNPRWVLGAKPVSEETIAMDSYRGACPVCPFVKSIATPAGTVTASFTNQQLGMLSTNIDLPTPLFGSWLIFDATLSNLSE